MLHVIPRWKPDFGKGAAFFEDAVWREGGAGGKPSWGHAGYQRWRENIRSGQVKCGLRQWLAIHAVSERPESQRAKAQGL